MSLLTELGKFYFEDKDNIFNLLKKIVNNGESELLINDKEFLSKIEHLCRMIIEIKNEIKDKHYDNY